MQANGMIFWDWNGTLMDDVDFTHSCLNWMLETHGYPQRYDLAAYREIFGFPIEEYYIRAGFDFAKHPYAELAERFMEHYNAGVDACPPSAHAAETLAELSRQGWRQSVLSASRRDYLIEQVAARGLQGYFTELLGLADIYGVSKVQVGKQWLAQSGIAPAACVMVGDTQHDAEVAKALGTKCVLYTGGHQSRARLEAVCPNVIDDLAQLPQLQLAILENGARYVKPDGILQYSTCTILKEENENVAKAFLQKHPEFVPEPVYPELGGALAQPMVTILPEMFGSDGFFVAKFRRKHS